MSHSFIQNGCWVTASFTSWRMKDVSKMEVKTHFSRRPKQFDVLTWLTPILAPAPPYFTADPRHGQLPYLRQEQCHRARLITGANRPQREALIGESLLSMTKSTWYVCQLHRGCGFVLVRAIEHKATSSSLGDCKALLFMSYVRTQNYVARQRERERERERERDLPNKASAHQGWPPKYNE